MTDRHWLNALQETNIELITALCTIIEHSTVESELYARGIQAKANEFINYYEDKPKVDIGHDLALTHVLKLLIQHLPFKEPHIKDARLEMLNLVREWENHCYKMIEEEKESAY
jgi:hypothetical protein